MGGTLVRCGVAFACVLSVMGASTVARAQEAQPAHPAALGLSFSLLPSGNLSLSGSSGGQNISESSDTDLATALSPFFDYALSPYFTLGFSPQIIFNVKGSNGTESATQYDFRVRLTAQAPVSPRILVFGRVSPGYSIIDLPNASADGSFSNPKGFLLDVAAGVSGQILPNAFVVFDLGYQWGFQSSTFSMAGQSVDVDFRTRYLHLGLGFAVTFGS
ncbi:MAG TPA: outer membrane beta-barrel protein [Polyangia bacterium]|nr:outer membrane beta-barrel protein [Polyangia bacterium]